MKSILVPIDHSEITRRVVDVARDVARSFGAEIHLVYVIEPIPMPPAGTVGYGMTAMPELMPTSGLAAPLFEPPSAPASTVEKEKLTQLKTELSEKGLKATVHAPTGTIVDEILKTADEVHADLIVMGRHGHGAMYNLLVGSVTEAVLKRASCPVLLVPSSRS